MMTRKHKMIAGLGAVALCSVIAMNSAFAQFVGTIESGDAFELDLTAAVDNAIDVTVVDMELGTFGTGRDPLGVDTATASLSPASVFTEDLVGPAKIVDANLADHDAAVITVSASPSTLLFVDYDNLADLTGTVTPANVFQITALLDNLNAPATGVGGVAGTYNGVANTGTQGTATTTGLGALVFNIGATFVSNAATTYTSEAYLGSFDMTISY